jgi:beta-xylosidase
MTARRDGAAVEIERVPVEQDVVHLKVEADFRDQTDRATFAYSLDGETWTPIGDTHPLHYTLDHFMGARFALFLYATETPGGSADFDYFRLDGLPLREDVSEELLSPDKP